MKQISDHMLLAIIENRFVPLNEEEFNLMKSVNSVKEKAIERTEFYTGIRINNWTYTNYLQFCHYIRIFLYLDDDLPF